MSRPSNIRDREHSKFVDSPTRINDVAVEVVNTGSTDTGYFGKYDEIQVTYPTTTTENYEYLLSSVSIGNITVTYTDSTKANVQSVVYNAV